MPGEPLRRWWKTIGLPVLRRARRWLEDVGMVLVGLYGQVGFLVQDLRAWLRGAVSRLRRRQPGPGRPGWRLGGAGRELARRGAGLVRRARRAGAALIQSDPGTVRGAAAVGGDPVLERVRPGESARLQELLAAIRRLRARLARDLPEDLAAPLREELRASESELIRLLLDWEDAGWVVAPAPAVERDLAAEGRAEPAPARAPARGAGPAPEAPEPEAVPTESRPPAAPRPAPGDAGRAVSAEGVGRAGPAPAPVSHGADAAALEPERDATPEAGPEAPEPGREVVAEPGPAAPSEAGMAARTAQARVGAAEAPGAGEARADGAATPEPGAAREAPAPTPEAPAYEEPPASARPAAAEGVEPEERPAPSPVDLARLRAHFERGDHVRLGVRRTGQASWVSALQWLDQELEGRQPGERVEIIHGFLQARLPEAYAWPSKVQWFFVGWISSVLREAQDDYGLRDPRLAVCFSQLTEFSKRTQPGWVPGLSRQNAPTTGSWREDADDWLQPIRSFWQGQRRQRPEAPSPEVLLARVEDVVERSGRGAAADEEVVAAILEALRGGVRSDDARLIRLAEPVLPILEEVGGEPRLRSLRQKIRRAIRDREQPSESGPPRERWSHEELTRDATVLLAGGMPREDARQRLEQEVPFHHVDWPELTGSRAIQAAADRVRSGSYDLVILLTGFASHEIEGALGEACAAADVPLVRVAWGYGTARVRHAIENALPAPASGAPEGPAPSAS